MCLARRRASQYLFSSVCFNSLLNISSFCRIGLLLLLRLLVNDIQHLLFDGLLLHLESVLVPDEVGRFGIAAILLHAGLEKANDVAVVWILSETQTATVMHELSKLLRLILTQLVNRRLFFLLFDCRVFFGL